MSIFDKWKRELKETMADPWEAKFDSDHPKCPSCGATMDFYGHDENGDFPYGEGYWKCGSCGYKVTEDEL